MPKPYLQIAKRYFFPAVIIPIGLLLSVSDRALATQTARRAVVSESRTSLSVDKDSREAVAFNTGWRWVYRKKVVERLIKDVTSDDAIEIDALRSSLSVRGSDLGDLIKAANDLIGSIHEVDPNGAQALATVVSFLEDHDAQSFERALGRLKLSQYHGIGYLLLGRYYENKGFFPEANGYYRRVKNAGGSKSLSEAALFLSGRVLFFQNRLSNAKKAFESSVSAGNPLARRWLANVDLIRGEQDVAWELYSESDGFVPLDSITRMSLADTMLAKGEFESARRVYGELEMISKEDPFLSAYFSVRKADAYLGQGLAEEALSIYSDLKQKGKGEPWALATLALADALATAPESEARSASLKYYGLIAEGEFIGTEAAYLGLVRAQAGLGMYEAAVNLMKKFRARYPASSFRSEMKDLGGEVVHRWTDELFRAGDYYGVAKVDAVFAAEVPFGKKAEGYMKAGLAASELGLLETAVRHLNMAVKVGSDPVVGKAMIGLARVYIEQNDWQSAERMLSAHDERFRMGVQKDEAQRLRVRIARMKGDMKTVAGSKADPADAKALMLKAEAMSGIRNFTEASVLYLRASRLFQAGKMEDQAVKTLIAGADAGFSAGNYKGAALSYKEAALQLKESKTLSATDRSWALYRLAKCYMNLGMKVESDLVLKELDTLDGDMKGWAQALFKDSAAQQGKRSGI
mgnify:CR=1 FL=1